MVAMGMEEGGPYAARAGTVLAGMCTSAEPHVVDAVVNAGGAQVIARLLGSGDRSSMDVALGALVNLCLLSNGTRDAVVAAGAVEPIVKLLGSEWGDTSELACGALMNLSNGS